MSKKKDRPWQIPRIEIDEHVGRWQAAMVQDFQGLLNEASDVENDTVEEKERERERVSYWRLCSVFPLIFPTWTILRKDSAKSKSYQDNAKTPNKLQTFSSLPDRAQVQIS